ncbi:MAG: YkgJ family cysteine cluster protein [Thermodesulfobacteriota bacterium]
MDQAYRAAAEQSGFVCSGCEENCCRSRFYHYTWLEYFYLLEGFHRLAPEDRRSIRQAAENVRQQDRLETSGADSRPMCPLNLEGRCRLYPHRPMICRLHGIRHKLQRPGKVLLCGPGCETFERLRPVPGEARLDRTPYYRQMAELELKFKNEAGICRKVKMTIAEMILSFDAP